MGALAIRRKLFGENNQATAESLRVLGLIRRQQGRLPEANPVMRQQLAIMRKVGDPAAQAFSMSELAGTLHMENKFPEAESLEREALAIQRKLYGSENVNVLNTLTTLAGTLNLEGKLAETKSVLRETLAIRGKIPQDGLNPPTVLVNWLGSLLSTESNDLLAQGKRAEAENILKDELSLARQFPGELDISIGGTLFKLAEMLRTGHTRPMKRRAIIAKASPSPPTRLPPRITPFG